MITALVTEGSSDRVLVPILRWLLFETTGHAVEVEWLDLRQLAPSAPARKRPGVSGRPADPALSRKVKLALQVRPCDLLFVHRDADQQPVDMRVQEIRRAAGRQVHVPIVPVRETEAWLLINEEAIRRAAGRPSGTTTLGLPPLHRVEEQPRPKELLLGALNLARGDVGRKRERFRAEEARGRIPDFIDDWSPLRKLHAFQRLEVDLRDALTLLSPEALKRM